MKRRRVLLVVAAALGVGVVLCWPRGPHDPVYEGKRLSQWMAETNSQTKPGTLTKEAIQAIKALGTNAVPYLLSEFKSGGPKWLEKLKQGSFVSRTLEFRFEPRWVRLTKAISGLAFLGPDAAPALPTLARYFDDPQRGLLAVEIIFRMQEAGFPYLLQALSSTNPAVIMRGIDYFSIHGNAAEPVIPRLVQLTDHPDKYVRVSSTFALRSFPFAAGACMPALRRALFDSDSDVRRCAASTLEEYGTAAKPAVPDLAKLLNDTNEIVRVYASRAIRKIDPSALPRSGP